jgi:hypothetical protein
MANGKRSATKKADKTVWTDESGWCVRHGVLRRGRGHPGKVRALFQVVGEKIPFPALKAVESHLREENLATTGVYVAHDSMGTPRYIGRGNIFGRLASHQKAHMRELLYFSFYVVAEKIHEREVETLLIRAAGPSLHFNERKKRVDIEPGNVRDYEAGTVFYERQYRRGRRSRRRSAD